MSDPIHCAWTECFNCGLKYSVDHNDECPECGADIDP